MIMGEKKKGFNNFKFLIKRLQNHLQFLHRRKLGIISKGLRFEEAEEKERVPDDVKEGHFVILAVKNDREEKKPIRFVLELCVLKHPAFLRLLNLAEEEYGFQQEGAIALPCQPEEITRILKDEIMEKEYC